MKGLACLGEGGRQGRGRGWSTGWSYKDDVGRVTPGFVQKDGVVGNNGQVTEKQGIKNSLKQTKINYYYYNSQSL